MKLKSTKINSIGTIGKKQRKETQDCTHVDHNQIDDPLPFTHTPIITRILKAAQYWYM